MTWLAIWFGISNICVSVWLNEVGQNRKTNEEHDEDYVEERVQLAEPKFDRDGEGGREALGTATRSINTWDESELELIWSKKSSSNFEDNFLVFLLSSISNS